MTLILLDRHLICSLNFSLDNTPEPFDFALAPSSPSQNRACEQDAPDFVPSNKTCEGCIVDLPVLCTVLFRVSCQLVIVNRSREISLSFFFFFSFGLRSR